MRIKKLYCPWDTVHFGPKLIKKYGFEYYSPSNRQDRHSPLVVFGCYGRGTKADIMNHSGLCVIVWSGSDSTRLHEMRDFVDYLKNNKDRVFHIAHSHWIQTDLKHFGIDYIDRVVIPSDPTDFKFEEQRGDCVYHYGAHQKLWYYGTHLINKLEKKWNKSDRYPNIIKTTFGGYRYDELYELYKRCFIGVRLTEHDNMAMSVIEMGLMGRRSIFNGNVPCAIPYPCPPYDTYTPLTRVQWVWQDESLLPIIGKMILDYREEGGCVPSREVSEEMREFVNDDEKWLNTEYYD